MTQLGVRVNRKRWTSLQLQLVWYETLYNLSKQRNVTYGNTRVIKDCNLRQHFTSSLLCPLCCDSIRYAFILVSQISLHVYCN